MRKNGGFTVLISPPFPFIMYGIINIGVFGSASRRAMTEQGDIDIIRYREKMNAFLKRKIEEEAIYV